MTEAEWLSCTDPIPMVGFIRSKASDRKFRLLGVACIHRVWKLIKDKRSRQGVEAAELHADGHIDEGELDAALVAASDAYNDATYRRRSSRKDFLVRCLLARAVESVAQPPTGGGVPYRGWESLPSIARAVAILQPVSVVERVPFPEGDMTFESGAVFTQSFSLDEHIAQANMIREIFGNPFRPVAVDPVWLNWNSGSAIGLAQSIYDDRTFGRLPLLADALEDAGCTDVTILNHCRSEGPHVRGCYVIDAILGKH